MPYRCGKVFHFSAEDAEPHADELERIIGKRPSIYKCKYCTGWHVGYTKDESIPKSGRRKRNFKKNAKKKRRRDKRKPR